MNNKGEVTIAFLLTSLWIAMILGGILGASKTERDLKKTSEVENEQRTK